MVNSVQKMHHGTGHAFAVQRSRSNPPRSRSRTTTYGNNRGRRPRRRQAAPGYIFLTVLLCILFWPLGMVMLWNRKIRFTTPAKALISLITLVLFVLLILFAVKLVHPSPGATNGYKTYNAGTELAFTRDNPSGNDYFIRGISDPEASYTWTDGYEAEALFNFGKGAKTMRCKLNVGGTYNGPQQVKVYINDAPVYQQTLNGAAPIVFAFDVPKDGLASMKLELPMAVSPAELNQSSDGRVLAIQLSALKFIVE